ncbi:hypothetical protein L3Q67_15750 [Saccharothrix sp. AJ9571]|nr:hypothetical protein L3Q67_15750 [Saccharothrix sp. AJ9571]
MEEENTVVRAPKVRIQIDLNSRSRDGSLVARIADANGPLGVGHSVTAFEPDDEVAAPARVVRIDRERGLTYLDVAWDELADDTPVRCTTTVRAHSSNPSSNGASPVSMLLNLTRTAGGFLTKTSSPGVRVTTNEVGLASP